MSVVEVAVPPPSGDGVRGPGPQEAAWRFAEGAVVEVMSTVNVAVARLVAALRVLLDTEGWAGHGIQSPEHWVTWKAGVSRSRADGLVAVARRADDLPECMAPVHRRSVGRGRHGPHRPPRARRPRRRGRGPRPDLLISQLDRLLRSLPEQADGAEPRPEPERVLRLRNRRDGWLRGEFCLPPDEGALVRLGLTTSRDAEFRDRNDLPADDDADADTPAEGTRSVSLADGLIRMASEAADALDPTLARTGQRGERNAVVLHIDIDPDGTLGPAQLEMGPILPHPVARYLACDANVQVMTYRVGQLIGIHPTQRTPNRAMRRYLARRDQGCTHPLCAATPLAARAPHRVLGRRGSDRAAQPGAAVPLPPPRLAPRRVLHRRQP